MIRLGAAVAAALLLGPTASAGEAAPVKAWITLEPGGAGPQQFVGYLRADRAFEGRFELLGERRGGGGTSQVRQGGSIRATAGQTLRLSQLSFGDLSTVPHYTVHLRIYRGEQLVQFAKLEK